MNRVAGFEHGRLGGELPPLPGLSRPPARVALWVLMAVIGSLFFLLSVAYAMRMHFGDWQPLPEPALLWWNTALLALSSAALQLARSRPLLRRRAFVAGGALALAFIAGQLWAWRELVALGYFAAANPANAFFYLLTAVHAVHLAGGLVAWGRVAYKLQRGGDPRRLELGVALCSTYWHYLLLLWLWLLALLWLT